MKDFGIFLIKPDGVERRVNLECEKEFCRHKLQIISEKQILLTTNDIKKYFYYQLPDYIEYMCSGYVIVYLLVATDLDIDRELFLIKDAIRKRYFVRGRDLKNLVHASHCGTEYFLQRKLFFPEYENRNFTSYADMLVNLPNFSSETITYVKRVMDTSWVKKVCINIPFENFKYYMELIQWYLGKENSNFFFSTSVNVLGYTCKLYCYCPVSLKTLTKDILEEIKINQQIKIALGEVCPINYDISTERSTNFAEYVQQYNDKIGEIFYTVYGELLKQEINVTGIVVNTANMKLVEAETRYEVMQKLKLSFVGGSDNWKYFGLIGISKTKSEEFLK